jgi:hypothetical protein
VKQLFRKRSARLTLVVLFGIWPATTTALWPYVGRTSTPTVESPLRPTDAAGPASASKSPRQESGALAELASHALAVGALCISVLALIITLRNYRRKSGMYVRGAYSTTSSRAGDDIFVSELLLENLKDRSVTIFSIHLKIGHNYYLQIENLDERPLVLKPFETYRKEFGPIEFYAVSSNKIILNDVVRDRTVKKRLILSTSDGRYRVRPGIRRWSPIGKFFHNHMTAIVLPISSTHKEKYLGGKIAYVIEIVAPGGAEEIIPIHPRDYELKIFKNFSLTRDSLATKDALQQFLQKQVDGGSLSCKSFVVYDLNEWRKEAHEFYSGETFRAVSCSALQYYVVGRAMTIYSDWKLRRQNALIRKKQ